MAGKSKASKKDPHPHHQQQQQPSIQFKWIPLDATSSVDISTLPPGSNKRTSSKHSQPESPPEILTTAQIVSAIGKVWDCAKPKPTPDNDNNALHYSSSGSESREAALISGFEKFCVDPKYAKHYYTMVNSSFECNDIAHKTSLLELCSSLNNHSVFGRHVKYDDSFSSIESWKVNGHTSLGLSLNLGNLYERINRKSSLEAKYPVHITQFECKETDEIRSKTIPTDNSAAGGTDCCTNVATFEDSPLGNTIMSSQGTKNSVTFLHSDKSLKTVTVVKDIGVASIKSSECHTGLPDLNSRSNGKVEDQQEEKNMLREEELVLEYVPTNEICTETKDKPLYARPDKRHALAGALSGTCVSLCLHPVDTIKTVIQSRSMAEKSIFDVVRSIISDRGVTGLYRGIASNIASSAPISAVYTYTYESVKGALLPLLPKEYHSVAHCMAGGCASVATSFIFTPSERIKQQMQLSTQYHNCWAALVGILGRGGFSSLYAGWGAVLCRNIPHSIIKFYTYEKLKQLFSSSTQSDARPSTYQTLICGGLAGSTAALFTTPFDVAKTRLQTQIPGSLGKYDGVFHALQEISNNEGLKGLYRGLTPRLVMYISQGALFFASYEIFKSIFALELPQICTPAIQEKHNTEDDSTSSATSLPSSSNPRLLSLQSQLEPK